jgi:hypothetical protein
VCINYISFFFFKKNPGNDVTGYTVALNTVAVYNDEFKTASEIMIKCLLIGGMAPCMFSELVYNYITETNYTPTLNDIANPTYKDILKRVF